MHICINTVHLLFLEMCCMYKKMSDIYGIFMDV